MATQNCYLVRAALDAKDVGMAREKLAEAKKYLDKPEPSNWNRTNYRLLKTLILEAEGLVLAAENNFDPAVAALRESVKTFHTIEYEEPVFLIQTPYESLGNCLIQAQKYDEAVKAFEDGLVARPNSGWILFGIGRAHQEAGKTREADKAYRRFLKTWATADRDRPEIKQAEEFLARTKSSRT